MMSAIQTILTKSQREIVLGEEGAAVLEFIVQLVHKEQQTVQGLQDLSYAQVVSGVIALCCLQRVQRVGYGSKGFVLQRALRTRHDEAEDWMWEQEQHQHDGRDCPQSLRRSLHVASLCYSVLLDMVVGDGGTSTKHLLASRQETLVAALSLHSQNDVLSFQWDTEGPHAPGFLLIADRNKNTLVLAIRGTMSASDALTDLRCDSATLSSSLSPGIAGASVHRGMWESAVRMDGKLRHMIEEALAPGGACEGMRLRVVGHSLGAGVASLLTLRWREMVPAFRQHHVHCHAFGPPCILDAVAAQATAEYITSVVVADDAVCRWSLASTKDVLHAATILVLSLSHLVSCLCVCLCLCGCVCKCVGTHTRQTQKGATHTKIASTKTLFHTHTYGAGAGTRGHKAAVANGAGLDGLARAQIMRRNARGGHISSRCCDGSSG